MTLPVVDRYLLNHKFYIPWFQLIPFIFLNLLIRVPVVHSGSCPINSPADGFFRLGQSKYYLKKMEEGKGFKNYEQARDFCKTKDMQLATLTDVSENVFVGREFEALVFKLRKMRNTLYYVGAQFDLIKGDYVWDSTGASIQYQNILYNAPNEIGSGSSTVFPDKSLCLTFGSPYPTTEDPSEAGVYGWSSSLIEWPCDNPPNRFEMGAMCETVDPSCDKFLSSSYDLDPRSYSGVFPLANRRFVVSWDQMSHDLAEQFCMKYDMTLYSPNDADGCLLPYIKDHWPDVTTTHFYTSVRFDKLKNTFTYSDGEKNALKLHKSETVEGEDEDPSCVTVSYTNERMHDPYSKCKCKWSMMSQAVVTCSLPAGVICQHPDSNSRHCLKDAKGALAQEFVTALGDKRKRFYRSVRKVEQKRAHSICMKMKYTLVTSDSDVFHGFFKIDNPYKYDLDTYWIHDPANSKSDCMVAVTTQGFHKSEFEKRRCIEKNFFLCEDKSIPADP